MEPAATVNLAKLAGAFLPGRVALPGLICSRPSIRSYEGRGLKTLTRQQTFQTNPHKGAIFMHIMVALNLFKSN
jgi:hypothetical protein